MDAEVLVKVSPVCFGVLMMWGLFVFFVNKDSIKSIGVL